MSTCDSYCSHFTSSRKVTLSLSNRAIHHTKGRCINSARQLRPQQRQLHLFAAAAAAAAADGSSNTSHPRPAAPVGANELLETGIDYVQLPFYHAAQAQQLEHLVQQLQGDLQSNPDPRSAGPQGNSSLHKHQQDCFGIPCIPTTETSTITSTPYCLNNHTALI
jgi:hypothetical protein